MLLRRGKEQTVSGKVNRNIWLSHFWLQWNNQRDLKSRSSERGHPCARTWAISSKGIGIGFEHMGDFLAILPSQEKEWALLEVKRGALWSQHSLCGGKWLTDKSEFRESWQTFCWISWSQCGPEIFSTALWGPQDQAWASSEMQHRRRGGLSSSVKADWEKVWANRTNLGRLPRAPDPLLHL